MALVDLGSRRISCQGTAKSSIDTGVQEMIYRRFPKTDYLLHFHSPWGRFSRRTKFPFPCGTVDEGEEIISALGDQPDGDFALELVHHGALLGLTDGGVSRLTGEWNACRDEYRRHLVAVHKESALGDGRLRPVFADAAIVGVVFEIGDAVAVHLSDAARGQGIGRQVVEQIIARRLNVLTVDDCGVRDYYVSLGFTAERIADGWLLKPPAAPTTDELFCPPVGTLR